MKALQKEMSCDGNGALDLFLPQIGVVHTLVVCWSQHVGELMLAFLSYLFIFGHKFNIQICLKGCVYIKRIPANLIIYQHWFFVLYKFSELIREGLGPAGSLSTSSKTRQYFFHPLIMPRFLLLCWPSWWDSDIWQKQGLEVIQTHKWLQETFLYSSRK